jgi:hypothetical protein
MRFLTLLCVSLSLFLACLAPAQSRIPSTDARQMARKLAHAWVDSAAAGPKIDDLANRSIAYSGMVAGLWVTLDGKRFKADQALMDSALTLLGPSNMVADARAMRNTVYILTEIAEGRASKKR